MLALLLHICKVLGSNLGPETSYTDEGFMVFLSPSRKIPGQYLKVGHGGFLPYPSQIIIY
jgi:hypothetical protein